jgi:hypothetical protein
MFDLLVLVLLDLPNFIISLVIIIFLVFCTSYTNILINNKEHRNIFKRNNFMILFNDSYNKIIGYIILLLILDLSHIVFGKFEYDGFNLFFISIPPNHKLYDIYITAFTILFFKELLMTLKNITKLGIHIDMIVRTAENINKRFDNELNNKFK